MTLSLDIRSFNDEGLQEFQQFLDRVKSGHPPEGMDELLTSPTYSRAFTPAISVSFQAFESRWEAGEYFTSLFEEVGEKELQSTGLWAWLSLFYFDVVCPEKKGRRDVREIVRYIPVFSSHWKYYRHLLHGPFSVYRAHNDAPERALAALCTSVDQPGEVVEFLASRQQLITCPAVMETARQLYVKDGSLTRGSARKTNGGARRFARIIAQLELTYDLFSISPQDLIDILPSEFDEFRPES